jgi:hypothetical protein
MRSFIRRTIYAAVVPALVVAGIAVAQSGGSSSSGSSSSKSSKRAPATVGWHVRGRGPGGPPGIGFKQDLTYAEIHAQEDGKAVVYRTDRGKIKSVDSDSITITENDGSDVTIPVNSDTRVFSFSKGPNAKLSDLADGQTVTVERKEGQPASSIMVEPTKDELSRLKRFPPRFDRDHDGPPGAPPFGP